MLEANEEAYEEACQKKKKLEVSRMRLTDIRDHLETLGSEKFCLYRQKEDWQRKKDREATATLRRAVAFAFEIAGSKEWYVVDATLRQALSKRL